VNNTRLFYCCSSFSSHVFQRALETSSDEIEGKKHQIADWRHKKAFKFSILAEGQGSSARDRDTELMISRRTGVPQHGTKLPNLSRSLWTGHAITRSSTLCTVRLHCSIRMVYCVVRALLTGFCCTLITVNQHSLHTAAHS
jgi:hypothetical protein